MNNFLTYNEAHDLALEVRWKTVPCSEGESCWCRMIEPEVPLFFKEGTTEAHLTLIPSGCIDSNLAEYFVNLHNEKIK